MSDKGQGHSDLGNRQKKMAIFGYLVLEQSQKYSLTLLKVMLQACATLLNDIDIADIGCLN